MEISAPLPALVREGPELGEVEVAAKDADRRREKSLDSTSEAIASLALSLVLHFGPPIMFFVGTIYIAIFGTFCGVAPAPALEAKPPARVAIKLVEMRELEPPKPVELARVAIVDEGALAGSTGVGVALEGLATKKKPETKKVGKKKLTAQLGLLKVLGSKSDRGEGAAIFGTGSLGSLDDTAVYGGLIGSLEGSSVGFGSGGLGLRGSGPGGGGTGIGIGGLGTIGTGRYGPRVELVESSAGGGLSKEQADRMLRIVRARMYSCYRTGLAREAALEGKVVISFAVDAGGAPSRISLESSTLGDNETLECIKRTLSSLTYPPPNDGSANVHAVFRLAPKQP